MNFELALDDEPIDEPELNNVDAENNTKQTKTTQKRDLKKMNQTNEWIKINIFIVIIHIKNCAQYYFLYLGPVKTLWLLFHNNIYRSHFIARSNNNNDESFNCDVLTFMMHTSKPHSSCSHKKKQKTLFFREFVFDVQ